MTLAVGRLSFVIPDVIGHTVWRHFGEDYGFFPLFQPLLGLVWLLWPMTMEVYGIRHEQGASIQCMRGAATQKLFDNFAGAPDWAGEELIWGSGRRIAPPKPREFVFLPRSRSAGAGKRDEGAPF